MFAKLYDLPEYGQVLVKIDRSEEGTPEVRFFAEPPGLGVCAIALSFADDAKGWEAAERAFERCDETQAGVVAEELFASVRSLDLTSDA